MIVNVKNDCCSCACLYDCESKNDCACFYLIFFDFVHLSGFGGALFGAVVNAYVAPINVFIVALGGAIWLVC
jgi:hypothetical protein